METCSALAERKTAHRRGSIMRISAQATRAFAAGPPPPPAAGGGGFYIFDLPRPRLRRPRPPTPRRTESYLPIDDFLVYYPFFVDFGSVSLSRLARFCAALSGRDRKESGGYLKEETSGAQGCQKI
jgi:hypothetical protein